MAGGTGVFFLLMLLILLRFAAGLRCEKLRSLTAVRVNRTRQKISFISIFHVSVTRRPFPRQVRRRWLSLSNQEKAAFPIKDFPVKSGEGGFPGQNFPCQIRRR